MKNIFFKGLVKALASLLHQPLMAYPSLTQLFGLCLLVIIDLFVNIATVDIIPYPKEIRPCVLLHCYRAALQVRIVHLYLKYLSFKLCNETCLHGGGKEKNPCKRRQ